MHVVGSSPEMLVKVQGREVFYRPIAGTRWRGKDEAEDCGWNSEMLSSEKERAEHIMLVDLGRNDLGRVCEYGSVKVEKLMTVERYSHVMHLVSSLRGQLREDVDCFDALMSCFPAGTVSGAPKVRAMEIIEELEKTRRGIYAGGILYLDFAGQPGFVHRAAHHGHQKWSGPRASGWRNCGRLHACGRVPGVGEQTRRRCCGRWKRRTRNSGSQEREAEAVILLLDNYDSFTYNLAQYLGELGCQLEVHRNDRISVEEIARRKPERIVISPGPCTPQEAGISVELIQKLAGKFPILGVCLGHQAIGAAFGGKIMRAPKLFHGKTSEMKHDGKGIFRRLPNPIVATRYHSLIVERKSLPKELEITAETADGIIMGMRHRQISRSKECNSIRNQCSQKPGRNC